jgi:predicted restriction endonuclease
LDVNNGILLSPNVDALFDKHLISFTNEGELLKSSKISLSDLKDLGISLDIKIPINKEMIPYLERHRMRMNLSEKK